MGDASLDLDTLMARLAQGERAAFEPMFRILWPVVRDFCISFLKSEPEGEDAAQQAMTKILARASDYEPHRPALPWALAIAAWESRTERQRRTRRREDSDERAYAAASPEAPEDDLVERDLVRAASSAMGELSASDQDVLLATFLEEAADVTGATLRKRRERAVKRLRLAFWRIYRVD